MLYYRPLREISDPKTGWTTIRGELLTTSERKKYFKSVADTVFEKVSIPKTSTFFSFGVRLEAH